MQGSQTHAKQIQRAIEKRVRQVIAASEIKTSTRRGNKELTHLIKRLANQPIASLSAAAQLGEVLGQQVIAVSQKMGRSHLDQGVIRQLVLLKQVPGWAIEPESSAETKIEASPEASGVEAAPDAEVAQLVEAVVTVPAVIELPPVSEGDKLVTSAIDETEANALDQNALDEDSDEEDLDETDLDEVDLDEEDLDEEDFEAEDPDEEDLAEDLDEDEENLASESLFETEAVDEETLDELDEPVNHESPIAADLNEVPLPEIEPILAFE